MLTINNLENYFIFIASGNYLKARRIIDNIPLLNKNDSKSYLTKLFNGFITIVNLERKYYSIDFLNNRKKSLFSRKESYSETYGELLIKIDTMDICKTIDADTLELSRLAKASIFHLCNMRTRMTEMYIEISQLGKADDHRSIVNLIDMVRPTSEFVDLSLAEIRDSSTLWHIMGPLLDMIKLEIDTLLCLAEAQELMSNLYFLVPINLLHSADEKCQQLLQSCSFESKSNRIFGRHSPSLHLLSWIVDLYNTCLAKYTLYFHPILVTKMTLLPNNTVAPHEGRAFDLVQRISAFIRKASVSSVLLVFDATKQIRPFLGHGYVLPSVYDGHGSGLQSYPVIFSCPMSSELVSHQIHCAIVMLIGRLENGDHRDESVNYLAEPNGHRTYFLAHVDHRVYLALIFDERRDREKLIVNFIENIRADLRGRTVIDQLASIAS